ncbi:DinB family protein [Hazenella sp. IB182357]|uniref:DinB family protein n=1 Tax=Polycladospora coralii TaxID=2771432 RepID=A0A926RTQ1_9BACL|nr:DinB family protein [Polycladospora coralii]MBD1371444.1 DinB family protein [Polycladospora coralii]
MWYVQQALHQLEVAVRSVEQVMDQILQSDLDRHHSLRKLLVHLVQIPSADCLILNEATEEAMKHYYQKNQPTTKVEMQRMLRQGFEHLQQHFQSYSEHELQTKTMSHWGVCYSRFEWLLQIVAHFYHHRGQMISLLKELPMHVDGRWFE